MPNSAECIRSVFIMNYIESVVRRGMNKQKNEQNNTAEYGISI